MPMEINGTATRWTTTKVAPTRNAPFAGLRGSYTSTKAGPGAQAPFAGFRAAAPSAAEQTAFAAWQKLDDAWAALGTRFDSFSKNPNLAVTVRDAVQAALAVWQNAPDGLQTGVLPLAPWASRLATTRALLDLEIATKGLVPTTYVPDKSSGAGVKQGQTIYVYGRVPLMAAIVGVALSLVSVIGGHKKR